MTVTLAPSIRWFATALAATLVLAITAGACPDTASAQKAGPKDEKALQILQGMSDYLAKARTLSFKARTLFDEVRESGIKIKSARTVRAVLKRPSALRVLAIGDNGTARSVWFDGAKLTVLRRHANEVMELPYKGTIDGLLDELIAKHEAQLPLADLLYADVAKGFEENIISSEYLGIKRVKGVKCHHLSFESTGADWQIWVQADSTPVPRRFAITYVNAPEKPEFLASIGRWSIDGEAADYQFQASVPKSAKSVPFGK